MAAVAKAGRSRAVAGLLVVSLFGVSCGGDDDSGAAAGGDDDTTTEVTPATGSAEVKTDFGVDDETIRLGILTDLSGPFSVIATDTVVAQKAYWEKVNAEGGVAGRKIELVITDTKYDVPTHRQQFQGMRAKDGTGVVMLTQSAGSPHTVAIRDDLAESEMMAVALSFYSGWSDPAFRRNVFAPYTNFCFEAVNSLQWLKDELKVTKLAIATFPGEGGEDSAIGAHLAAEKLGLQIVYDGAGKIVPPSVTSPNPDNSGVATAIAGSGADVVWVLANPATLAALMGQAASKGFKATWSGAGPSYNSALLKSDVKGLIDASYYQPGYAVSFGTDVPAMDEMTEAIKASKPDAVPSDYYVIGWSQAQITEAVLRQAAEDGDLTRAGVTRAASQVADIDFGGLAPAQNWMGTPNQYIVRESYMFKPRLSLYKEGPIGTGHIGSELLKGPFSSPVTDAYDYEALGACFKPKT